MSGFHGISLEEVMNRPVQAGKVIQFVFQFTGTGITVGSQVTRTMFECSC
jgi:hypothetical protein